MLDVFLNIFLVLTAFLILSLYFTIVNYYKINKSTNEMQTEDAKFLKRKVKSGAIDVHPHEKALVLQYEVEYILLAENQTKEICREKKDLEKVICLPSLNSKTDCSALAKAVIEKCELIHPSKLAEIEQLIFYLKGRKHTSSTDSNLSRTNSATSSKPGSAESKVSDTASIIHLEEYIELLYEDIPEKIRGSNLILQLTRDPDNLDFLSTNEAVLSALSRVLREDWKRSIVLSTNLIYTFFCFSTYSTFHSLIMHYKVGSLCMDIIHFELDRYQEWTAELKQTETETIQKSCSNSSSMNEFPRSKIPEAVRPRSGNWSETFNINKSLMAGSTYEDLSNSVDNIEKGKQLSDAEKAKRYRTLIKKQEQLLRVAFYLLLNISNDENTELKMVNKNIVGLLIQTLNRENEDLLILALTFLKKLSIYEQNKDAMASLDIIDKLPRLLQTENADMVHLTLKLLFNLSFDLVLRNKMVKRGFLPKFVSLLSDDRHQNVIIKLLYHLSMDEKVKAMFSYTDCVSLITDMILLFKDDSGDKEMISLAINLATNQNNAQQMVENNRLRNLMTRAFKFQNAFLMKMIRNISYHKPIKQEFLEFIGDLANALTASKVDDFIVECLGVMGNIWLPELDYHEIFNHFKLVPWFRKLLKPDSTEHHLMFVGVIFLGTVAEDKECALLLNKSGLLKQLIELLKIHQVDDDLVYQIIFVFYQILLHEETRDHVIMDTDMPGYLIDLVQDPNKSVSGLCDSCLDIISDCNVDWARRIQIEKFRYHNVQWLQMVESHAADEADDEDELDELPPYMDAEFLATHSVPALTDMNGADNNSGSDSPDILDELTLSKYDQGLDLAL